MKEDRQPPAEISENNDRHGKESHSSFRDGHCLQWSDSDANNTWKCEESSGWPSWETLQANRGAQTVNSIKRDRHEIPETMRKLSGDSSYRKRMSPTFDEFEPQKRSRSPENCWSRSRRGRGESRSRSRDRGRSRSRSRSSGRGRSRSRSRSRSRGRERGWCRSRSRSPLSDHRREPFGWSGKRRSGLGISSQPCRDFAGGSVGEAVSAGSFIRITSITEMGTAQKMSLQKGGEVNQSMEVF
ncbi:unnamed protein product [Ilex paraguariensis]|uniref:Uncharacterized protein n=1 Tax=Ilex paraguariensis TaxID=185542 RepID=A0ABC8R9G2_9AQUA